MNQHLPPWSLVKTWLGVLEQDDISPSVKHKRTKLIDYYFGSNELADMYVEQHQHNDDKFY